jgi:hypothetical protein
MFQLESALKRGNHGLLPAVAWDMKVAPRNAPFARLASLLEGSPWQETVLSP